MKRASKFAIGIGTALTLGLAAAVATAHPHAGGPGWGMEQGPGPGMGPMGHAHAMGPQGRGNPAAQAEARLAYLKAELKITSGQEPAWKTFADQARQQAEAMRALRPTVQGGAQSGAQATAPERLEQRNQIMKKRQEQAEKATAAFKDLYAALTPEQKAIADQRFAGGHGAGRGFRGGPGGRFN